MEGLKKVIESKKKSKVYRYSLRRLTIGVVSCVVGAFMVLGPVASTLNLSNVSFVGESAYAESSEMAGIETDDVFDPVLSYKRLKAIEEIRKLDYLTNEDIANFRAEISQLKNESDVEKKVKVAKEKDKKNYINLVFKRKESIRKIRELEYLPKEEKEKIIKEIAKVKTDAEIKEKLQTAEKNNEKYQATADEIKELPYLSDKDKEVFIYAVKTANGIKSADLVLVLAKEKNDAREKIFKEISKLKYLPKKEKNYYKEVLKSTDNDSLKLVLSLAKEKAEAINKATEGLSEGLDKIAGKPDEKERARQLEIIKKNREAEAKKAVDAYKKKPWQKNFEKAWDLTKEFPKLREELVDAAAIIQKGTDGLLDDVNKPDEKERARQLEIIKKNREAEAKKAVDAYKKKPWQKNFEKAWDLTKEFPKLREELVDAAAIIQKGTDGLLDDVNKPDEKERARQLEIIKKNREAEAKKAVDAYKKKPWQKNFEKAWDLTKEFPKLREELVDAASNYTKRYRWFIR
ncbi:YSIRK-type signal peptide-containing protein [Eubacteriales bacterium KG125]